MRVAGGRASTGGDVERLVLRLLADHPGVPDEAAHQVPPAGHDHAGSRQPAVLGLFDQVLGLLK